MSVSVGVTEDRSAFDDGRVERDGVFKPFSAAFSVGVRLRTLRIDGSAIGNYSSRATKETSQIRVAELTLDSASRLGLCEGNASINPEAPGGCSDLDIVKLNGKGRRCNENGGIRASGWCLENCSRCEGEHSETDDIDNVDSRGLIWVVVWALWAQRVGARSSWKRPLMVHRLAWDLPKPRGGDPMSAGGCGCLSAGHPLRLPSDLLQMLAGLAGRHFHLCLISASYGPGHPRIPAKIRCRDICRAACEA